MHRFCLEGKERKKDLVWRLERGFIGHYDAAWAGSFGRFKLNICTCLFCICQETFYSSRLFISSRRARTVRAANPRSVGLPKFLAVGYRALDASAHCFWLHANTRSNQCNVNATPLFFRKSEVCTLQVLFDMEWTVQISILQIVYLCLYHCAQPCFAYQYTTKSLLISIFFPFFFFHFLSLWDNNNRQ